MSGLHSVSSPPRGPFSCGVASPARTASSERPTCSDSCSLCCMAGRDTPDVPYVEMIPIATAREWARSAYADGSVKAELERAFDLAERLEVIAAETETLTRGRIFGPTLERRLRTSIETILSARSGTSASPRRSSRRGSRSRKKQR